MTDPTATPVPDIPERKAFPADRLMKLAAAREKAIEVRRRNAMIRRKDELERITAKLAPSESVPTPVPEPASEVAPESKVVDADIPAPVSEDEQPSLEPKVVKKKKQKKQTIVVEQSSDDSDEFESNQNIVFVKRVRRKKENITPPEPPRVPEPTPEPVRPPPPQLTQEQQQIHSLYNTMFSGGFTSGPRFGRR